MRRDESEAWCTTFHMKMSFEYEYMKIIYVNYKTFRRFLLTHLYRARLYICHFLMKLDILSKGGFAQ